MPSQGYTLFDLPGPKQTLVHVFPGAEELGRVFRPLFLEASCSTYAQILRVDPAVGLILAMNPTLTTACKLAL